MRNKSFRLPGRKVFLISLILFALLVFSATALVFITATKADFDLGTYNGTNYNVPKGFVQLQGGNLFGTYTSKIFEVNYSHTWDNITWVEGIPYGDNLPDNNAIEKVLGGANMSGNVLLLHLDENNGTAVADTSGNGNNGVATGASWTNGRLKNALSFNGVNSNIRIPNSASLNPSSGFAIEMWVNSNDLKRPSQALVSKWEPGSGNFTNNVSNSWQAIDLTKLNTKFRGFAGGAFDGRYIYLVPNHNYAFHGNVLRYDTLADFTSDNSWQGMNMEATLNNAFRGYDGAVFDGRYVYFVPYLNSTAYHGNVVRYDTTGAFTNNVSNSWQAIDMHATLNNSKLGGYRRGIFDGRYVYFVPWFNSFGYQGNFVRYDTTGAFTQNISDSWQIFDASIINSAYKGYVGGIFDGRYVYFMPDHNGNQRHGNILRYDTSLSFSSSSSWQVMNAQTMDSNYHGFSGGSFDGRYAYFVPLGHETLVYHGNLLRYDTTGSFTINATNTLDGTPSWQAINLTMLNNNTNYSGYSGAVFDGRHLYLVPAVYNGNVLKYDTKKNFTHNMSDSWQVMSLDKYFGKAEYTGYTDGVFDGRYAYFIPQSGLTGQHGSIFRYNSAGSNSSYSLLFNTEEQSKGGPFGITAKFATSSGTATLSSNTVLTSGWHHIVASYDGTNITLFVDGTNRASKAASGTVQSSAADLIIGATSSAGLFNGTIDEVAIYNRPLSLAAVQKRYERGVANLNLTVRTSNNSVNWTEFRGVGNSTTAFTNSQLASLTGFDNFNYLQYRFNFETTVSGERPSLYNVTISYTNTSTAPTGGGGGGGEAPLSSGGGGGASVSSSPTPTTKTETTKTSAETTTAPQTYEIVLPTETYTATVTGMTDTSTTIQFSSGAPAVTLGVGQSSYVDLNGDNIVDAQVTLKAINNGVPDLIFEVLPTEVQGVSETEQTKIQENAPTGFLILQKPSAIAAIIGLALAVAATVLIYRKKQA